LFLMRFLTLCGVCVCVCVCCQRGKLHFGYIYGISILGCTLMWILLNLMCPVGIDVFRTVSVLGYCLLPMVLFSACAVLYSMQGIIGIFLGDPLPPVWQHRDRALTGASRCVCVCVCVCVQVRWRLRGALTALVACLYASFTMRIKSGS